MFKTEGLSIFYKGYLPICITSLIWLPFFALSHSQEELRELHQKFAIPAALAAFLFSHPFLVIAAKV